MDVDEKLVNVQKENSHSFCINLILFLRYDLAAALFHRILFVH